MSVVCTVALTIATMIRPSGHGVTMTDFMKQVDVGILSTFCGTRSLVCICCLLGDSL